MGAGARHRVVNVFYLVAAAALLATTVLVRLPHADGIGPEQHLNCPDDRGVALQFLKTSSRERPEQSEQRRVEAAREVAERHLKSVDEVRANSDKSIVARRDGRTAAVFEFDPVDRVIGMVGCVNDFKYY
jgi:hypothetical protein